MHQRRFVFLAFVAALTLGACAPAPTDYSAELKPALDHFIEAWNTGNMALLDDTVADDFRRTEPFRNANSRTELEAAMTGLRTGFPDMKVVVDDVDYGKDRAYVHWTFTGTNTGPGETPPTNKPVNIRGYTTLHFENGKIAHEDVYFDGLSWMTQLGATVEPPGAHAGPKAAVAAFVAAWNTGDMSKLDVSTTDNFRRTEPAGNTASSREEMKGVMTGLRTAYPDTKVVITDSRYAGDHGYLNWTFTGTNTGPGDAPPTNKPVKLDGYTIVHFDGDRIAHEEAYFDMLSWLNQLGATVTPPAADSG